MIERGIKTRSVLLYVMYTKKEVNHASPLKPKEDKRRLRLQHDHIHFNSLKLGLGFGVELGLTLILLILGQPLPYLINFILLC